MDSTTHNTNESAVASHRHAPAPIASVVNRALNAYLRELEDPEQSLKGLAGRVLVIDISDLGWVFQIMFSNDRLHVRGRGELQADTRLTGTSVAFGAAAAKGFDSLPEGIEVHGSAGVAQGFTRLLNEADLDWEDILARRIGDFPARQVGKLARGALGWSRRVVTTLGANISEYLQEEARYLPTRVEINTFFNQVDDAREACDRLEARITRAERNH